MGLRRHLLDGGEGVADGVGRLAVGLPGQLHGEHARRGAVQQVLDAVALAAAALVRVTALLVLRFDVLRAPDTSATGACATPCTYRACLLLSGVCRSPWACAVQDARSSNAELRLN